jgi:hypothetical protein
MSFFDRKKKLPLVFDLGMHVGDDTAFYLARGLSRRCIGSKPATLQASTSALSA